MTDNEHQFQSDDVRTGFTSGNTFTNREVRYAAVDGLAIFEGDILLGTVEEMEAKANAIRSATPPVGNVQHGVVIAGDQFRWPHAKVPYDIDPNLPRQSRVTEAIEHWEEHTCIRFILRTPENAAQHPNFVHFRPADGCFSQVGMQTGQQDIGISSGCRKGNVIHEIGHAVGLWHEQSREDRNSHVTIHLANVIAGKEHNFNQHISDGDDVGDYDYASIMHYPEKAFSKNSNRTITTIPEGIDIGQRDGLSTGDIAAVQSIYTHWHDEKNVVGAFATPDSQNAWANIEGLGWRKIRNRNSDAITNMFAVFCEAKANDRKVRAYADGVNVYQAYVL